MMDSGDPFYEAPKSYLIGTATLYLEALNYLMMQKDRTPIMDYKVHPHTASQATPQGHVSRRCFLLGAAG